jgi:hypothetical protein
MQTKNYYQLKNNKKLRMPTRNNKITINNNGNKKKTCWIEDFSFMTKGAPRDV